MPAGPNLPDLTLVGHLGAGTETANIVNPDQGSGWPDAYLLLTFVGSHGSQACNLDPWLSPSRKDPLAISNIKSRLLAAYQRIVSRQIDYPHHCNRVTDTNHAENEDSSTVTHI